MSCLISNWIFNKPNIQCDMKPSHLKLMELKYFLQISTLAMHKLLNEGTLTYWLT